MVRVQSFVLGSFSHADDDFQDGLAEPVDNGSRGRGAKRGPDAARAPAMSKIPKRTFDYECPFELNMLMVRNVVEANNRMAAASETMASVSKHNSELQVSLMRLEYERKQEKAGYEQTINFLTQRVVGLEAGAKERRDDMARLEGLQAETEKMNAVLRTDLLARDSALATEMGLRSAAETKLAACISEKQACDTLVEELQEKIKALEKEVETERALKRNYGYDLVLVTEEMGKLKGELDEAKIKEARLKESIMHFMGEGVKGEGTAEGF